MLDKKFIKKWNNVKKNQMGLKGMLKIEIKKILKRTNLEQNKWWTG